MQGIEMISVTVSELTAKIKARLESDLLLQDVLVRGEISNYKRHSSGHLYFTMKDEEASLRCVMFRSYAARLPFEPQDGEGFGPGQNRATSGEDSISSTSTSWFPGAGALALAEQQE